jgi:hypothetical protein
VLGYLSRLVVREPPELDPPGRRRCRPLGLAFDELSARRADEK